MAAVTSHPTGEHPMPDLVTLKWPGNIPVPQAWLEFNVEDVAGATALLEAEGYRPLVKNRTEPLGANREPPPLTRGTAARDHLHARAERAEVPPER